MIKSTVITFLICLATFSVGCSHKENNSLEEALSLAGENRTELEKVLNHYAADPADSLKYRAACFLIENLPGHFSYKDTSFINAYHNAIDSVADLYYRKAEHDSIFETTAEKYSKTLDFVEDIHILAGDYLIMNIDSAFSAWQNGSWAKHVDFDEFCEYILPYKIEEKQTLDNWREYFSESYVNKALQVLQYNDMHKNLAYRACQEIIHSIQDSIKVVINYNQDILPIRKMSTLTRIPSGPCDDYSVLVTAILRAKGLPVAIDYTPQWPFRNMGHSWNVLLINYGKNVMFNGIDPFIHNYLRDDHPMAKVFRRTYKANEELVELLHTEKNVPEAFKNPFIRDVSTEYLKTVDVEIPVKEKKHKYVYLAVFDNVNWFPIYWAKVEKGKAVFRNMGRNITYLPVAYGESGIIPVGNPINLNPRGEIRYLNPDFTACDTLTLRRKYLLFGAMYSFMDNILDLKVQASNSSSFRNAKVLYTTKDYLRSAGEIHFEDQPAYRYWRFYKSTPNGGNFNIAEIMFFEPDSIRPTYGKIIGTEGSYYNREKEGKEAAFDHDALTFFDAPWQKENWVGMDFGKPIPIEKIIYYPRSDGNFIELGDEYELVYWHGDGWQSLGKQTANDISLKFANCPSNALFLLHDRTKGKEERIFTYDGDNLSL
jgi:hypothetical protein